MIEAMKQVKSVTIYDYYHNGNPTSRHPFTVHVRGDDGQLSHSGHLDVTKFCFNGNEGSVRNTTRTNVIIRDMKGRFMSYKKLDPAFYDLSKLQAFPDPC